MLLNAALLQDVGLAVSRLIRMPSMRHNADDIDVTSDVHALAGDCDAPSG